VTDRRRTSTLPYLPGLDALRALAVTAVFAYHAIPGDAPGGFIGVDIFFVLSGYLITSLLLREFESRGGISLRGFWARRARRLFPAVWLLIAVCLVISAVFIPDSLIATRRDALASLLYVQNWNLILESQSYFGAIGRPPLLQHLWTLSIEEQFYLVWPLVLLAVLPRLRARGLLAVCLTGALGSTLLMWALYAPDKDPSRVYFGTATRAAPLLLGAALAIVWPAGRLQAGIARGARITLDALGVAALVTLLFVIATVHDYQPGLYRGGLTLIALVTAVLIAVMVHPGARLGHLADRSLLRWLGARSYGIYLWHWPVIVLTRPNLDVPIEGWPLVIMQATITLAIAAASYRFLEQPIRRHGFGGVRERLRLQRPGGLAATGFATLAVIMLLAWSAALAGPRTSLAAHLHATRAAQQAPTAIDPGPAKTHHTHHHQPPVSSSSSNGADGTTDGGSQPPADTTPNPPSSSSGDQGDTPPASSGGVLAIGDSVMLGAAKELQQKLGRRVRVDADVGRQIDDLISRLDAYRQAGALPPHVVIQVGDNGPVWYADLVRLKKVLQGVPDVVFVSVRVPRSWQDEANTAVRQFVHRWPQAHIADWYSVSGTPGLLWDGIHPNDQGRRLYANVIAGALS
jgi:peptidoglycan/LPS O-acetylase OafA/YrhL